MILDYTTVGIRIMGAQNGETIWNKDFLVPGFQMVLSRPSHMAKRTIQYQTKNVWKSNVFRHFWSGIQIMACVVSKL